MHYTNIRGMKISKLTLGTVQLGMDYGIANKRGKPDKNTSYEIIQTAIAGGVNSLDTSLHYGDSEVVIGNYLSSYPESLKSMILTTKFKIASGEKLSRKDIERQIYSLVEQSLNRLNIKKIPIYMIHNPEDMIKYGDIVPKTLKKIKEEGLIENIAVSVYTSGEVDEMLKNDIYEAIQIPMNIIDNRLVKNNSLKKLYEKDKIVFVRSVFLQGLFFMEPSSLSGNLIDARDALWKLERLADREGMSIQQLAVSYVRDMIGVCSLVIGAETIEQVRDNIKLMEGPSISQKTRNDICCMFDNTPLHVLNPSMWKK